MSATVSITVLTLPYSSTRQQQEPFKPINGALDCATPGCGSYVPCRPSAYTSLKQREILSKAGQRANHNGVGTVSGSDLGWVRTMAISKVSATGRS